MKKTFKAPASISGGGPVSPRTQEMLMGGAVPPPGYKEQLAEVLDALENMAGAFNTPVRRLKMPGEFQDEVCKMASKVLKKHGRSHGY